MQEYTLLVNSDSAIGIIYQGVFNRACFCKLCPRDRYQSVDELLEVHGIGAKPLESMRPYVTVR
jgi:type II secretory pathway component PulK